MGTQSICWVNEDGGCPGLGNFEGAFVKEAKGKITYEINDGVSEAVCISRSRPML
jgi:hypothetical protein